MLMAVMFIGAGVLIIGNVKIYLQIELEAKVNIKL